MGSVILIADSGSTKTDWCVIKDGASVMSVHTMGLNPYFQTSEEMKDEIENILMPQIGDVAFDAVYFYGAGCVFDKVHDVRALISSCIKANVVEIYSDLLAAAHSACGHDAGIACILGTGSNSCFYDGVNILNNVAPLGYILGDEGGGATLGRLLVSDILKELLPEHIRDAFYEQYKLTQADILDRVYKQPFPNRFLASLSPFLYENIDVPEIKAIVLNSFTSFLTRNVMQYDYEKNAVNFIGSIAYHYREILIKASESVGLRVGKILKSPMNGLISYYNSGS